MEKNKKYILTEETIEFDGHTLYRIKARRQFGTVNCNDLGGYIESEENLSQEGYCWVYNNAKVYGDAKIYGNARIYNDAIVESGAQVLDDAHVYGHAFIKDSYLTQYAAVGDNAIITNGVSIGGSSAIGGNVEIINGIAIQNGTYLRGNSKISHQDDFITFQLWWKGDETITYVFQDDKWFTFDAEYSTDYLIEYEAEKTNGLYVKTLIEMMKLASKLQGMIDFNSFIYQIDGNFTTKTFLSNDKVSLLYDNANLQVIIKFDKEHIYKEVDVKSLNTALNALLVNNNFFELNKLSFIKNTEIKQWKED